MVLVGVIAYPTNLKALHQLYRITRDYFLRALQQRLT